MKPSISAGCGIIFDGRHGVDNVHCFLVLSPEADGKVVMGNFTTIKPDTAITWQEITVEVGEHPFIDRPSCFPMRFVAVVPVTQILKLSQVENTVTFGKMDPDLHIRIIDKILTSTHCPSDVKEFVVKNFGSKKFEVVRSWVMEGDTGP